MDAAQGVGVGHRPVAEHEAGQVHRQEAAASEQGRQAKRDQRGRHREHGVEPGAEELEAADRPACREADGNPDRCADSELHHEREEDPRSGQATVQGRRRQGQRHDDGDRVVEARLDLQRGGETRVQVHTTAAKHREDRGCVGRGDDGPEEESLGPGEAEQTAEQRRRRRRGHHADGGEQSGRRSDRSHPREGRVETAVEQDERQGNAADAEGRRYSEKLMRGVTASQAPLRITELPKWTSEHRKVPAWEWKHKDVRTKANCVACHKQAAAGDYSERSINIPK